METRPIYTDENAQAIVLTLKPGESLRRSSTPVDVFFYVLEGKGIVEVARAIVHSPSKIIQVLT